MIKEKTPLINLIQTLSKIPGIGQRSAVRAVYHLAMNRDDVLVPFSNQIEYIKDNVQKCSRCLNISFSHLCAICCDEKRDKQFICIVEKPQDIHAIEKGQFYRGTYFVIQGLLSAFNGITPEHLSLDKLISRVKEDDVKEIIFALPATQDGRTTLHYISDRLSGFNLTVTMPAQGMPLGSDIDFIDQGTMATAFRSRIHIE